MMVTNQGLAFENRSLRNDLDLAKASEVHQDCEYPGFAVEQECAVIPECMRRYSWILCYSTVR